MCVKSWANKANEWMNEYKEVFWGKKGLDYLLKFLRNIRPRLSLAHVRELHIKVSFNLPWKLDLLQWKWPKILE